MLICSWTVRENATAFGYGYSSRGMIYFCGGSKFSVQENVDLLGPKKAVRDIEQRLCFCTLGEKAHLCCSQNNFTPRRCVFASPNIQEILSKLLEKAEYWVYRLKIAKSLSLPTELRDRIYFLLREFLSIEQHAIERNSRGIKLAK